MTPLVQPGVSFPATLHHWEHVLTGALLRVVDGNADPIRSFEITPERLAFFCGQEPELASAAEEAFRRALVTDRHLAWRLQHGSLWNPGTDVPGCMSVLALSLLVDSLMDGDYGDSNEYRAKLRQWLGIDRSFMALRGIALMWEELVGWLDARANEGAPFRRLVLPVIPKTWTHIGYTRYLCFPTRRDLRFLIKQVQRNPRLTKDPAGLVRLLDPEIGTSAVSLGLKEAFAEFRTSLRSGRATVDHRFWRLVERARSLAGEKDAPLSEFRMEFDEDGRRQYRLSTPGQLSFPHDIGAATSSAALLDSPNLGPGARRGILFFQSIGLASWTASGEPPTAGEYHVALATRHQQQARGVVADWEPSGTWIVTKSVVAAGKVGELLKRLGIHNARENLVSVALVDGVHVGAEWLGFPTLLPRLEGARGSIDVQKIGDGPDVHLHLVDGRLVSGGTVEGQYLFGDLEGSWSRRATFVTCAEVHAELAGSAYASPLHEEWRSPGAERTIGSMQLDWDDRPFQYQDLVEGLYASSRSGIGEGDAVALIDRVMRGRSWDFLRTLVEATFFDERLRLRWRGRTFTLGSARLEEIKIGGVAGVIVSGAVPLRLESDFNRAVALHGGAPFRRLSDGLAPPILGAIDIDAGELARALGWVVSKLGMVPAAQREQGLVETAIVGESYLPGSRWDWAEGRFRVDGAADAGPVTLTRLIHPGGRDHDLYRVVGPSTRTFTSRHSAILDAHGQAGVPMFERVDGRVLRLPHEGALPVEIARSLRRLAISNGGACADGWSYQVAPRDQGWLATLLPGLVSGIRAAETVTNRGQSRRGRGARRAIWINGAISA